MRTIRRLLLGLLVGAVVTLVVVRRQKLAASHSEFIERYGN
jgi:hypothetical protein